MRKKKNKKAFTIIELLVAIMIIGILTIIAVPLITKYLENGRQKYYTSLGEELEIMAKNYFTDNKKELPRGQLNLNGNPIYYKVLAIEQLKETNYITNDIVDTKNNSCEESYITIENNDGIFEYQSCLICNGEVKYGDKNICTFSGTLDNTNPTCSINYNGYEIDNWTNNNVNLTITGEDESGIGYFKINNLKILSLNSIGNYTIDKIGKYTIYVYDKAGNRGECTTGQINIDKKKPTCEMKELEEFTTVISKTIEITGSDELSDITELKIENNELEISEDKGQYIVRKNGTYTGTVTDKAGNTNTCSIDITGLDTNPPVITASITKNIPTSTSGVYGIGSEVTVTCTENESTIKSFSSTLEGVEGTLISNNGKVQSKKNLFNVRGANKTITATCIDEADNLVTKTFNYNIQEYSQNSLCGWNSCLTGSNTCSYGCSTGTSCGQCTSCQTGTSCGSCRTCPYTCYYACPSAYTYCGSYGPSCCNSGRQYVGSGSYSCGCYSYSCNCYNYSYNCYNYSCNCYNYSYDCSDCYYGSNTCVGGNNTCWHY